MKFAKFAGTVLLAIMGVSATASADVDVIVKPGESKSIYISRPQRVNLACVGAPEQPSTPLIFLTALDQNRDDCLAAAVTLSALDAEDPSQGISGASAKCDLTTNQLSARFLGIRAGAQTRLIARHLSPRYCQDLADQVKIINSLTNTDASIQASYLCDGMGGSWVRVSVSRFQ